jgi:TrmH family RNA methyltransferase
MKEISSLQNPLVKKVLQLKDKGRLRKETGLFVIEGIQEVELALEAGYRFSHLFFREDTSPKEDLIHRSQAEELIRVSDKVYAKLAHRGSTEGLIGLAYAQSHRLEDLKLPGENPLVLVAEAPEKPGNIGALLRTARAAGVDAVCIANPRSDLYHPNIIRSSVGCLFGLPIALASSTETLEFLEQKNIGIYAAALEGSISYLEADYTGACALVVGTESTGLGEEWLAESHTVVRIPMKDRIDSLNVSVATGILIYEALRQRTMS